MDENSSDKTPPASMDSQTGAVPTTPPPAPASDAGQPPEATAGGEKAVAAPPPPAPPPEPAAPVLPNLKALPYEEAMAVMHRLMTYQKLLEQELARKEQELVGWHEKVAYARSKGDERLAGESWQRLTEVQAELEDLASRLETERVHNAILRDQLNEMTPSVRPTPPTEAASPLQAPAERRSDAEIERDFQRYRTEDELAEIKRKLGGFPQDS